MLDHNYNKNLPQKVTRRYSRNTLLVLSLLCATLTWLTLTLPTTYSRLTYGLRASCKPLWSGKSILRGNLLAKGH